MGWEKFKESDTVMASGWHIERETSDLVYRWGSKRAVK